MKPRRNATIAKVYWHRVDGAVRYICHHALLHHPDGVWIGVSRDRCDYYHAVVQSLARERWHVTADRPCYRNVTGKRYRLKHYTSGGESFQIREMTVRYVGN